MLQSSIINNSYFPQEDYKPFSPYPLTLPPYPGSYHGYNPSASREDLTSTPSPHVPNTMSQVMTSSTSNSNLFPEYPGLPSTPPDCNTSNCDCEFDSKHPLAQETSVTNALLALNSAQSPDCKPQEMSPHKDDYSQEIQQPNDISIPSIKHEPMAPHNYGVLHPPTSNGFFPNPFDGYLNEHRAIYKNPYSCYNPGFPGLFSASSYPGNSSNPYMYPSGMTFGLSGPSAQQFDRDSPESLSDYSRDFGMMVGFPKMRPSSGGLKPKSNCICQICGKSYARPSTLKTHMRTHSGERPFKCHLCPKAFTQAANLTAHLRTHSGEKPFSCNICGKRFSQSSSVTTHMRTHSGEKPYKCDYCGRCFSDTSTLTKHKRVHSGEKPYQCKICKLSFSQSGNLHRHMKTHMNSNSQ
ncbi:Protein glass [Oopsacas minuta]|uniref:Protein glass n=1 Tax=Oopsacas minuta TaxID=111878 RepID=A0AAV7JGJ1_9METZ|nr:Protein glass [Oopsacas minuta]